MQVNFVGISQPGPGVPDGGGRQELADMPGTGEHWGGVPSGLTAEPEAIVSSTLWAKAMKQILPGPPVSPPGLPPWGGGVPGVGREQGGGARRVFHTGSM